MTKSRHRKSRWQDPILVAGSVQQIQHKFHPLYAFGFDGFRERSAQVACVDSHVIVYGLGGNVVFHSTSSDKGMKFFSSSVAVEAILWVEASPAGTLVAACEKLKTGQCQVSVIDVQRLEAINTFPAYGDGVFGGCAFSDNERQFMAACNVEHASQLDFWDVRDGRVLLSTTIPYEVNKITFNPLNNEEFAVSGPLQFKFWSIKEGVKKEVSVQGLHDQKDKTKVEQAVTFTDHVWLVETSVALSSANGRIYIIRNYAVQHIVINTGHTLCLLHTHRGFLAGKQDGSLCEYIGFDLYKVKIAEKEQKNPYAEVRPITFLSGLSPIASMVMPPNGEQIIYMVEGERVLKVHLGIGDDEDALLGADSSARVVPQSVFRMGKISGIDVCSQRMLLVTCGSDCLLRVWSYQRMVCEICHVCDEEPFLVTISPWGHYLFVAMARRIQIFRIVGYKLLDLKYDGQSLEELTELRCDLLDRLQHCKDIGGVKNIKQLKFSPSGHMVAAANAREILILCAFTWSIKAILKGHTGSVTAVAWSPDSVYITSAGLDGAIYGWFLDGYHRYLEYVIKGSVYSCLLVDPKRTFILACGPSLPLRVIDTDKKLGVSHGKEFSVIGEELVTALKDSKETHRGGTSSHPPTPESSHSARASVSPTSDDPVDQTPAIRHNTMQQGLDSPAPAPAAGAHVVVRKRDSTGGTEEHPEGSWVQHKYRSNCMFELTHEKPVTLMAGLFKTGVLITTAPGGEMRMYTYPFARDAPNLLKEVILLTTGDITGLCLDEDRRLIFACTTQGSIFISTVDVEILGPKVEDPYEDEVVAIMEVIPVSPGIQQYLQDTGTDAPNILLERDEVEEMKRDLQELKLTMAREVKDASFRAQRAALEWSADMKEREAGYLERAREYEVKVKLLSHNLHIAVSEKETAIQELLDAQHSTIQQLEDFYQNKLAQELERSHISRKQFQKDLLNLEMEMKDKEQIYLEKMVLLEHELENADARAEEAIKKVRDECHQVNENYKMEMEEDLLLSDEELSKVLEKLNIDVSAEKKRADENYEQLLQQKRHVMQVEKKMKDMQDVHSDHVELIAKLTSENAELKKTVLELDYEKRILKKVVLLTDEKTQHLVHERKDQETKTIVRDFKIQQLRKREQPLERELASLQSQLREMERHQLSHVMEMKHQTLIVDNMKSRVAVLEEDCQKLSDQLHERECYVDMFTRALCQLVQEHDVSEWPQLTRQLYFNYVKDVHRTDTLDHLDAYGEVMHQRENLEKFVAILQREIGRSEMRNWRETQKYMQQNLDMLHEYNEAQRNVRRLAFMTQKLQGDVVYWKAIAANPERRLRPGFENMRPSKATPQLDNQSSSFSRCSKSTRKSTPSNKIRASLVSSAELSRASSPGIHEALLSAEEEKALELFRSSTPVAHILKPYLHRGTIAAAATLRHSFIQNRPWSPEPQSDKDRAMILDLKVQVNEMTKELRKKDEIIEQMQRDSRLSSTYNYLPPARSQSLFLDRSASEEEVRSSGVHFSPSLHDLMGPLDVAASRRPKSVPTLRGREYQPISQKPAVSSEHTDGFKVKRDMETGPNPFLSVDKQHTSWVPKSAESLDLKLSSDRARADQEMVRQSSTAPRDAPSSSISSIRNASSPTSPVHPSRRASSPTGMSSILIDGSTINPYTETAPTRRSSSPPGLSHPRLEALLFDHNSPLPDAQTGSRVVNQLARRSSLPGAQPGSVEGHPQPGVESNPYERRASSPLGQRSSDPTYLPDKHRPERSPSPSSPNSSRHPRIMSLQVEDSSLAAQKLTGFDSFPPVLSPPGRRLSLSPPQVGLSPPIRRSSSPSPIPLSPSHGRLRSLQLDPSSPGPGSEVGGVTPPGPFHPLGSSSSSAQLGAPSGAAEAQLPGSHQVEAAAFPRRKSSLMKVERAGSLPGAGSDPFSHRKSSSPNVKTASDSRFETSGTAFVPPGLTNHRRKSSRLDTSSRPPGADLSTPPPPRANINPLRRSSSLSTKHDSASLPGLQVYSDTPGGASNFNSRRLPTRRVDAAASSRATPGTAQQMNPAADFQANPRKKPSSVKLGSTVAAASLPVTAPSGGHPVPEGMELPPTVAPLAVLPHPGGDDNNVDSETA